MDLFIRPPFIAHRGASLYAPENTLAAFRKAKTMGAQWVEFDVMLSHDHEVMVMHDDTLDRTTNGSGLVYEHSCAALKKLDAGSWFSPEFSGEKIPTLLEVIQLLQELNLSANIEIKPLQGKEELTVEKTMEVLRAHWKKEMSVPLISSFSRVALSAVRKISASSELGFLMHEWHDDWEAVCDQLQCLTVNVNEEILTQDRVKKIKASDRLLLSYIVNNVERAQELFSWGVDAVFSDDLQLMLKTQ